MSNGDDAMTSAEFAKLMGAYPEPAGNPSPAYGGFMDNSAANFSWVQNNDYFGAESKKGWSCKYCGHNRKTTHQHRNPNPTLADEVCSSCGVNADYDDIETVDYGFGKDSDYPMGYDAESKKDDLTKVKEYTNRIMEQDPTVMAEFGRFGLFKLLEHPTAGDLSPLLFYTPLMGGLLMRTPLSHVNEMNDELAEKLSKTMVKQIKQGTYFEDDDWADFLYDAESFSAENKCEGQEQNDRGFCDLSFDYGSSGITSECKKCGDELEWSWDDNEYDNEEIERASSPGNRCVLGDDGYCRIEWDWGTGRAYGTCTHCNSEYEFSFPDTPIGIDDEYDAETTMTVEHKDGSKYRYSETDPIYGEMGGIVGHVSEITDEKDTPYQKIYGRDVTRGHNFHLNDAEFDLTSTDQINNSIGEAVPMNNPLDLPEDLVAIQAGGQINGMPVEEYFAEMEELTDGVSAITNRFGDTVGMVQVDDEDLEDVSVEISDNDGGVLYEGILADEVHEREEDDYYAEMKKPSLFSLVLGVGAAVLGVSLLTDKLSFRADNDTQEMLDNDPELVENPNTGSLSPAQYEELVVESTGYAVDIIPMGLDGSFMGSRFSALPTERYVEYNDPGIGAHIDVALDRNENYLEPEMAMVQAAEGNEVKEAQAPGQSPYLSIDGKEPKDFSYRVLKETHPISLDPAVVPFIPQSMEGYTGNANRPPSVYEKMFKIGVLGQTPSFVPGNDGDIGANHLGTRRALPNQMGNIGGPLSDSVNGAYTDGQTSMSLAQWSIENNVQQTSDTEAMVIDRSSGNTKRIRRV
jgi:hypothetical protein